MIRKIIDKLRRFLLGPNLIAFARMPKADVHQLLAIGSDEFLFFEQMQDRRPFSGGQTLDGSSVLVASPKELEELRMELAILKEKINVLERVVYHRRPSLEVEGVREAIQ
jgi:hypothetical protein